jgi:Tfp pilus assembly protein PilF
MKVWVILLLFLLGGCAQAPRVDQAALAPLFNDSAFAPPSERIGAENLFTLSDEMRAHLRSPAFAKRLRERGPQHGLLDALYAKGDLKLEYDATTTGNAAQTYAARSGNCLSLVVMTAAFAKELGMDVRFQRVAVEESWTRNGDFYLVSSHVNLSLARRPNDLVRTTDTQRVLIVDFLPPQDAKTYRTREIEEGDIVVMFMNNRAAEALTQGRLDDAYWWARAAVSHPSATTNAYNTLGVVYQRRNLPQQAELVFRAALQREPRNVVLMQNLVPVLAANGKHEEAAALKARLAELDPEPPYHYFNRAMVAMNAGDYTKAKALFQREVRRAPDNDEFHFWLAVALLRLGEQTQAMEELRLAMDASTRSEARARYSSKLTHLRQLKGVPAQ